MWGPFVALGLLALLLVGALARDLAGSEGAAALVSALAVSPLLVYYGRTARPYGVAAPVAVAAVLLLGDWWRRGGRRRAELFVLGAVLVGWAMPVYVPFVLAAPLALLGLSRAGGEGDRARRRSLALVTAVTLAALALVLGPPLIADAGTLARKSAASLPGPATLLHAARLAAGLGLFSGLVVAVGLAVAGWALLARRMDRPPIAPLAAAAAAQLAALFVVRPAGFDESAFVAARYLLPAALALLLVAAAGAGELARRLPAGRWVLAVALLAIPAARWAGAMPLLLDRVDGFRSTRLYHLLFYPPDDLLERFATLPPAYSGLDPGAAGAVVEVPYDGIHRTPYGFYQHRHGREVFVGVAPPVCGFGELATLPVGGTGGTRLSRLVSVADPAALRARGVRWIVVHRAVEDEVPWRKQVRRRRPDWPEFLPCLGEIERRTGVTPVTRGGIAVFDLGPL